MLAGKRLAPLPVRIVAWEDFARQHPAGLVMSRHTPYERAYGSNPYTGYDSVDSPPWFSAERRRRQAPTPERASRFIERGKDAVAVPLSALAKRKQVVVDVGDEKLEVVFAGTANSALDSGDIAEGRQVALGVVRSLATGEPVAFDQPFWLAVAAFRPNVRIVGRSVAAKTADVAPRPPVRGRTAGRVIAQ